MSELLEPFETRVAALTAPIAGAKPAGDDVSFHPDFERVKAEVDKLQSVSSGLPNWDVVADMSARLLASSSKDMRLAVWFTLAQMHRTGWSGLAEGLVVVRTLVTTQWETMYPERRPRARANLYGWLGEQVSGHLEARSVAPAEADAVRASQKLFREIDAELAEKLGDLHPGMGLVRRLLESRVAALAPEPVAPPAAAASSASAVAPPPPVANPPPPPLPASSAVSVPAVAPAPPAPRAEMLQAKPSPVTSLDSIAHALDGCERTILDAARVLWTSDRTLAYGYFLRRAGAWLSVSAAPEANGETTSVPVPPAALRGIVSTAFAQARWGDVLDEGEPLSGTYVFWLDLHWMISVALQHLGDAYSAAHRAVNAQVRALVDRVPALERLAFADGTPFATEDARRWLSTLQVSSRGVASGADAALEAAEREAEEEASSAIEAAHSAIASGRVGDGVGLLVAVARRAHNGEEQFQKLLLAAKAAVEAKKAPLARPLLDELVAQIDAHDLEKWRPELCVAVYATLVESLRASKPAENESAQRQGQLLDKICRLDPALAVQLGM